MLTEASRIQDRRWVTQCALSRICGGCAMSLGRPVAFLGTPDDHGWEVKRKLIWLGTRSYLFRVSFGRYAEEQDAGTSQIAVIEGAMGLFDSLTGTP